MVIQLIESESVKIPLEIKINTHICFLTTNIQKELEKFKKFNITIGQWSEQEFYIDFKDILIDNVIEVMHEDVIKGE